MVFCIGEIRAETLASLIPVTLPGHVVYFQINQVTVIGAADRLTHSTIEFEIFELYNESMFHRSSDTKHFFPSRDSILEKNFVDGMLRQARINLLKDGSLAPVLFVKFQAGEKGVLPLDLSENEEHKPEYLAALGMTFVAVGKQLEEALMLAESWYVSSDDTTLNFDLRPREHPQRREAITMMGRNAERTRYTFVVQTFGRDEKQRPVMERLAVAEYNVPVSSQTDAVGLVDYLFPPRTRVS